MGLLPQDSPERSGMRRTASSSAAGARPRTATLSSTAQRTTAEGGIRAAKEMLRNLAAEEPLHRIRRVPNHSEVRAWAVLCRTNAAMLSRQRNPPALQVRMTMDVSRPYARGKGGIYDGSKQPSFNKVRR